MVQTEKLNWTLIFLMVATTHSHMSMNGIREVTI